MLAVLLVAALALTPSGAFTSSTLARGSSFDGASDANGIVGLAVASEVTVSSTERLVNVTNNRASSIDVTVALDASATDVGDLVVDGVGQGDSATFTLASGGTETVEISVPSDCGVGGRNIPFDVSGSSADFSFSADRSSKVAEVIGLRDSIAFQAQSDKDLMMLERDGTLTDFGFTTKGFGPADADLDCDGKMEIPYINNNDGISIVDVDGQTEVVTTTAVTVDTVLGVDDYDGNGKPDILFSNSDDSGALYRVEYGGSPTMVGNDIRVDSVAGVTDFNDDGDRDIVYNQNGDIYYYDGGEVDLGVRAMSSLSIGAPRDFDGDGVERVPFVSDNNGEVMLVDSSGNTEVVWDGGDTAMGSLGSFDWNDDGSPDILGVANGDKKLYRFDYSSGTINGPIQDSSGSDVEGDSYGVA